MPSIKELSELTYGEVARMSRKDLAKVVSQLSSAANKRLRRLERTETGAQSPSYINTRAKGDFSVAGKTQGELQAEFKRVTMFLGGKTSTVSGWKKYRSGVIERLGGEFASEDAEKEFWAAYRKLASDERALHHSFGSEHAQRELKKSMGKSSSLTKKEKEKFRELFPDDKRPLTKLTNVEAGVIRTMIEMGEDYEQRQKSSGSKGASSFFRYIGID